VSIILRRPCDFQLLAFAHGFGLGGGANDEAAAAFAALAHWFRMKTQYSSQKCVPESSIRVDEKCPILLMSNMQSKELLALSKTGPLSS
jgi:hypothetical protein